MDMKERMMALKGKKKSMSDNEMKAKSSVLEEMRSAAEGMMGDKLKGLKKVTVAAPSEGGLKEGLSKASELIDRMPEDSDEEMSLEGIEAKMAELMELKKKLMGHSEESDEHEAMEEDDSEAFS